MHFFRYWGLSCEKRDKSPCPQVYSCSGKKEFLFTYYYIYPVFLGNKASILWEGVIPPPLLSLHKCIELILPWLHAWSCDPVLANQSDWSRGGHKSHPGQWEPALGLLLEPLGKRSSLSPRVAEQEEWKPGAAAGCLATPRKKREIYSDRRQHIEKQIQDKEKDSWHHHLNTWIQL